MPNYINDLDPRARPELRSAVAHILKYLPPDDDLLRELVVATVNLAISHGITIGLHGGSNVKQD